MAGQGFVFIAAAENFNFLYFLEIVADIIDNEIDEFQFGRGTAGKSIDQGIIEIKHQHCHFLQVENTTQLNPIRNRGDKAVVAGEQEVNEFFI
jgi:hypothetical protein